MIFNSLREVAEKIREGYFLEYLYKKSNTIRGLIISPDTDGFVSGLLLNNFFNWPVIGFYDGKILVTVFDSNFVDQKEFYFFIDVEILRPYIKSVGHHILIYDNRSPHPLIQNLANNCLQPNNWREMDFKNTFSTKYPFGTFHLLLSLLYYLDPSNLIFKFNYKKAVIPSIYIDGVFKNLFNYPENCLTWLKYMTGDDINHPFEKLLSHPTTPKELIKNMNKFFKILNELWIKGAERKKGKLTLETDIDFKKCEILDSAKEEMTNYLIFLAKQYNFKFNIDSWPIIKEKLKIFQLKKRITSTTKKNYLKVLSKNPISLAITSKTREGLEYTLDSLKIF